MTAHWSISSFLDGHEILLINDQYKQPATTLKNTAYWNEIIGK